ncbi:hypothetical protein SDC9_198703 [bioreactor metagenome]|uniref:Uncharacterized protein n=1 Tax=bioreactor metagenome TaxID=1076179 RepID=A0A645IJM6_9ZZZZ
MALHQPHSQSDLATGSTASVLSRGLFSYGITVSIGTTWSNPARLASIKSYPLFVPATEFSVFEVSSIFFRVILIFSFFVKLCFCASARGNRPLKESVSYFPAPSRAIEVETPFGRTRDPLPPLWPRSWSIDPLTPVQGCRTPVVVVQGRS